MISLSDLSANPGRALSLAAIASVVFRRTAFRAFPEVSLAERLAMLPQAAPLSAPLKIRWSEQHVPFVEAQSERDAAVGLGIVHGHLRLAQMEVMRRAATGRLAEVVGEAALDVDKLLRLIDFPRATDASLAMMPLQTRAWVDGFADGINAAAAASLPPEFEIFGIGCEPWDAKTLFAVSRLCSADYAWKVWRTLSKLRSEPGWAEMWAELAGVAAVADEDIPVGADNLEDVLPNAFGRGSNCVALAPSRTSAGAPILACDPHHLITTPNLWLIAGCRFPGLEVWGLMIPALPVFGVGRNQFGAWGGTNLHATSSELVDVAGEPLEVRPVRLVSRGGAVHDVETRHSAWGPVVSDAGAFEMAGETVALHWMGHRPSDEFTSFRGMMAARSWGEFAAAADTCALLGLTMMWADPSGLIGKMMAVHVPSRPLGTPPDYVVTPDAARAQWETILTGRALPMEVSPERGFLVSANEAPEAPPVTISLFYAAPHRFLRLTDVLGSRNDFSAEDLRRLQLDVLLDPAHELTGRLSALARANGVDGPVLEAIAGWDGNYAEGSAGALAFELIAEPLITALEERSPKKYVSPYWRPFARLELLVEGAEPADLVEALNGAIRSAEAPFAQYGTWGELHRVRLQHPLARLPWILGRLPSIEFGLGGSNDTCMKTMHPFTQEKHETNFGQNARFVADLSERDATTAVLLGGQDGWPGSRTMFDMVGPWRRGEQVRLPFSAAALDADFPHVTPVRPASP